MSENEGQLDPGATLRQAREAAGLTVKEVADSLNLVQGNIEAIEVNQYDKMAGIFIRGYVKSYARFLRLDADALVAAADIRLKGAGAKFVNGKTPPLQQRKQGLSAHMSQFSTVQKVVAALLAAALIWIAVSIVVTSQREDDFVGGSNEAPASADVDSEE